MQISARVHLAVIPSAEKELCDLGMSAFVASHLFSAGRRNLSAVMDMLCLIKRLEEIHTKVQGMISFPHLATPLLYDVLRQWSQYLNM